MRGGVQLPGGVACWRLGRSVAREAANAIITASLNRADLRTFRPRGAGARPRAARRPGGVTTGRVRRSCPASLGGSRRTWPTRWGRRDGARRRTHRCHIPARRAYQRGRVHAELRTRQACCAAWVLQGSDPAGARSRGAVGRAGRQLYRHGHSDLRPAHAAGGPEQQANEAAITAVKLDPESAEAHTSLAFIAFFHDWDWPTAEARFKKAIELDPQYALAHDWLWRLPERHRVRQAEGLAEVQTALSQERQSLLYHRDVAYRSFFQRRYEEAIEQLRRTLERDPSYTAARSLLGRALVAAGRRPKASRNCAAPRQDCRVRPHCSPRLGRGGGRLAPAGGGALARGPDARAHGLRRANVPRARVHRARSAGAGARLAPPRRTRPRIPRW